MSHNLSEPRWNMIQLPSNGLKMLDLFCGAGIGAVGFYLAGYEIVCAIDNKSYAVNSYNRNIPGNHAEIGDLRTIKAKDLPYADIYAGGFPCTPFSVGGTGNGKEDENLGDLGFHYYRLVKEGQPKVFLFENVGGLIQKRHKPFFEELLLLFEQAGYQVSWEFINCWEHGVPQLRQRVFVVGIHKSINKTFEFPRPIKEEDRKNLRHAIKDLPNPEQFSKEEIDNIILNQKEYYDDGFSSRYKSRNRQKQWNEPSYTIVSQSRQLPLYPEPAHYDIRKMEEYEYPPPRRFTVRECLRLQTAPDWFSFSDDIKINHQYERCSGIPSLMAYKLGIAIHQQLSN